MKRLSMILAGTTAILIGNLAIAQEQAGVPEDTVKELGYLVGNWRFEGKLGDDVMEGTVTYRWAKGKQKYCLVEDWSTKSGDATRKGVGLMGWNATQKCLIETGFNSAGSCFHTWWKVASSTEWRGEFSHVENGQAVKGEGVVVKKAPDEFVYEGETATGETSRLVFRKVVKERKSRKAN